MRLKVHQMHTAVKMRESSEVWTLNVVAPEPRCGDQAPFDE